MSIIICGIPKDEEGNFYCPHCGFKSTDLEQFATSMCWSCVYGISDVVEEDIPTDEYEEEADAYIPDDDPPPWWE